MRWAAPWAWLLALAAILPITAHLWARHRPVSVAFPTLRFLRAASPASRRLRRIQDWPLFLLRLAIVAAVCAAAAGPTLVSPWRREAWRMRLHRIVLVDGDIAADASHAIADLRNGATSSSMLGPGPVADWLDEAIAQASAHADRMRTEIVVVWDGSRAAFSPRDLADVPDRVGLRLVVLEPGPASRASARMGIGPSPPAVEIRAAATDDGVRDRLLTALRQYTPIVVDRPIELVWPGASVATSSVTVPHDLLRVLDEIADDARVQEAAERSTRDRRAPSTNGSTGARAVGDNGGASGQSIDRLGGRWLARAADGAPLLRGWADGTRLVLVLDAVPTSPLAWWSVVAAVESLARPWRVGESVQPWSASELQRAQRQPTAPVTGTLPGGLDTRAAWGVVLALLLVEQWWRRNRSAVIGEALDAA